MQNRLSDRQVRTAKVPAGASAKYIFLADGGGLYLKVNASGTRSWVYRYESGGRQRDVGLGPYDDVTLHMAREAAQGLRRARLEGFDPATVRQSEKAAVAAANRPVITFAEAARKVIETKRPGWRPGSRSEEEWTRTLAIASRGIGGLDVAAISTPDVLRVLRPIWDKTPESASRLRGRIEEVLNWAGASGYRDATVPNPARWDGHLEYTFSFPNKTEDTRHPALPYVELPGFIVELRKEPSMAARALEFAILCASRIGEVVGAKWSEFDLTNRLWTIPRGRIKAGREHRVPLSDAAMALLERMAEIRTGDLVFPGDMGGKMNSQQPGNMMRRVWPELKDKATPHGFRATFKTWATERTNFPSECIELALAHNVGSKVERAYQRGDQFERRRQLMQHWADHCNAAPAETGERVVALRA